LLLVRNPKGARMGQAITSARKGGTTWARARLVPLQMQWTARLPQLPNQPAVSGALPQ